MGTEKRSKSKFTKLIKRVLISMLSLSMIQGTTAFANYAVNVMPKEVPGRLPGDIDGNGQVDLTDAQLALWEALNIITLTEEQIKAASVNGQEITAVKLAEVQTILRLALKIVTATAWPTSGPDVTPTPEPDATPTSGSDVTPTLGPDATPSPEPGDEIARITFEDNDPNIVNWNKSLNNSNNSNTAPDIAGNVLEFGAPEDEAQGIEVKNPFSELTEEFDVNEDKIAEAFAKTGVTLDAYYTLWHGGNTEFSNTDAFYYRVAPFISKEQAITTINNTVRWRESDDPDKSNRDSFISDVLARKLLYYSVDSGKFNSFYENYVTRNVTEVNFTKTRLSNAIRNPRGVRVTFNDRTSAVTAAAFNWERSDSYSFTDDEMAELQRYTPEEAWLYGENNGVGNNSPADTSDTYTFPFPTWENGLTMSLWVKSEPKEEETELAALFTFTNDGIAEGKGGLTVYSNGCVFFIESAARDDTQQLKHGAAKGKVDRNKLIQFFDDENEEQNKGKWVYMTIVIKNDGIRVYYNGVEGTREYYGLSTLNHDTGVNMFNLGMGHSVDDGEKMQGRMESFLETVYPDDPYYAPRMGSNPWRDLYLGYGRTKGWEEEPDEELYDLYARTVKGGYLLTEFLTQKDTRLHIGGFKTENATSDNNFGYSTGNEGVKIADMKFYAYPMNVEQVIMAYDRIKVGVAAAE